MKRTTIQAFVAHWKAYAEAFAQPIQSSGLVTRFVSNPNVTGAYAEAWVRSMVKGILGQRFRVSTGAVIRASDEARGVRKVPQCDLIVWDPTILPALFEAGDFALVPFHAVRAVIEIKRATKKKHEGFLAQLSTLRKVVPTRSVLGVVIQHPAPLFQLPVTPNWLEWQKTKDGPPVTRLLDKRGNPDTHGVLAFIYFLAQIGGHREPVAASQLRKPPVNREDPQEEHPTTQR